MSQCQQYKNSGNNHTEYVRLSNVFSVQRHKETGDSTIKTSNVKALIWTSASVCLRINETNSTHISEGQTELCFSADIFMLIVFVQHITQLTTHAHALTHVHSHTESWNLNSWHWHCIEAWTNTCGDAHRVWPGKCYILSLILKATQTATASQKLSWQLLATDVV